MIRKLPVHWSLREAGGTIAHIQDLLSVSLNSQVQGLEYFSNLFDCLSKFEYKCVRCGNEFLTSAVSHDPIRPGDLYNLHGCDAVIFFSI
jgi:hypothetical protein